MKNKGFSLVELIIVIAIMAILAAALAPALIRYITKARLSADIDTAGKLADAMVVALTNEGSRDTASMHPLPDIHAVDNMDGTDYKNAVLDILDVSVLRGKTRKDKDGTALTQQFYYTLDATKNWVAVYYGIADEDHQLYPTVGEKFQTDD